MMVGRQEKPLVREYLEEEEGGTPWVSMWQGEDQQAANQTLSGCCREGLQLGCGWSLLAYLKASLT